MALTLWTPPEEPRTLEPVLLVIERVCRFRKKPPRQVGDRMVKQLGCARCGKPKGDRDHLGLPMSMNFITSKQGSYNPMVYAQAKIQWEEVLTDEMTLAGLPKGLSKVMAEGELTFPDRRRRDQGNYRVLLEKALGDALQKGGWLQDDSWEFYEFGNLAYRYERGVARTTVVLFPS